MVMKSKNKGQMQIQQMAFMIIAVFIFFALVGIFFLRIQVGSLNSSAKELQREEAISSIETIANMPELNYVYDSSDSMTLDEDKLRIMSSGLAEEYEDFWPVASIEVYKIYPLQKEIIECPAPDCNYYKIYDNGQENVQKYSSFVSICKTTDEGQIYERCSIGKLLIGAKIHEE